MKAPPNSPNAPIATPVSGDSAQQKAANESDWRGQLNQLHAELTHLRNLNNYQHQVICSQAPMIANLQWEAAKWNHFKRLLEQREGRDAVARIEEEVNRRAAGMI